MYLHTLVCFFFFLYTDNWIFILSEPHDSLFPPPAFGINSILYQRGIYPPETFSRVTHYDMSLQLSTDPKLKNYLTNVVSQLKGSSGGLLSLSLEWLPFVLSTIVLPQGIFTATGIWPCRDNNKEILIEPGPYLCPHLTCTHKCDTISHTIAFYHSWIALYQCSTLATLLSSSLLPFEIGMLAKQSTSWRRVK